MRGITAALILACGAMVLPVACASTEESASMDDAGAMESMKKQTSVETRQLKLEPKLQSTQGRASTLKPPQSPVPRDQQRQKPAPAPSSPTNRTGDDAGASDRREARATPLDQSDEPNDVETTRRIRQALVQDGTLSFRAKNVMIVTNAERVLLTSRVHTRAEADRIKDIAQSITPYRIDDRLEVTP